MKNISVLIITILTLFLLFSCSEKNTDGFELTNYSDLEKEAEGTEVSFYMWGGSAEINKWVDEEVGGLLKSEYNISLKRVPMDAGVFINKLLTEKTAKKETGTIDLIWINGENFKNAKEANILYGPYTQNLPNFNNYVDIESVKYDFGFPVDGYEAPYGKSYFVFEYDSEKLDKLPSTFEDLLSWVKTHPGRFTYPRPPDFTGSAFVRLAFYAANGGYENFTGDFSKEKLDKGLNNLFEYLNALKPYLWQEGKVYPRDSTALDILFEQNEIDFSMNYNVAHAQNKINTGQYPESVRTFVLKKSALYNLHFTGIPYNAPNKAGALVLSNLLMSPEIQLSKNNSDNWGDLTVLNTTKLSEEMQGKFKVVNKGDAILDLNILYREGVPEINSEYLSEIESAWEKEMLK
ncbi:MAG: ABC transporter substrate-binding protein [Spirochaetales bacterium]|nr:ABC transporter substrate-binding protein [Spirochaetales bacterium]